MATALRFVALVLGMGLEASALAQGVSQFEVTLPDGAVIELLGVGEHPSAGKAWWKGDGTPLAEPLDSASLLDKPFDAGHHIRELAVRARKPGTSSAELRLPPFFAGLTRESGMAENVLIRSSFSARRDAAELDVKVAYAAGLWKEAGASGLGGNVPRPDPEEKTLELEEVVFAPSVIRLRPGTTMTESVAVSVSHTLRDHERRLVAIDAKGKRHAGTANSRGHGTGKTGERVTDSCEFRDLGDVAIARLLLETRPRTIIEFRHVSLQPGRATRVHVRIDGKPSRSGLIVGKVVDDSTGAPVEGAVVLCGPVVNEHDTGGGKVTTGKDGVYTLSDLSPGIYNVFLKSYEKDPRLVAAADDGVLVTAGAIASSELRIAPGRKVSGRLFDADEKPAAGRRLGCYSAANPSSTSSVKSIKTEEDGSFEILLPPGPAYLYTMSGNFIGEGKPLAASTVLDVPVQGECPPVRLMLRYSDAAFGDTSWLERSTKGTKVVRRDGGANVSGVVVDGAGKPVAKARVFASDGPETTTNDKGEFALPMGKGIQFIMNAYAPGYRVWFGTPLTGDVLHVVLDAKK